VLSICNLKTTYHPLLSLLVAQPLFYLLWNPDENGMPYCLSLIWNAISPQNAGEMQFFCYICMAHFARAAAFWFDAQLSDPRVTVPAISGQRASVCLIHEINCI